MNQIMPDVEDAIAALSEQYQILGDPLRLAILQDPHGEQQLFDQLLALYRPEFADNQRILVIQAPKEIYSYQEDLASDSLIWLQKNLQTIDISNFFVIVISGNPGIQEELQWVQQHHSTDDRPITAYWIDVAYERQDVTQDTFCPLPWIHLHVTTQLDIAPCCSSDQTRPWGNLEKDSVMDIVNGEQANQMRLKMLQGHTCVECKSCYVMEKNGHESARIVFNKKYSHLKHHMIEQTNADGSIRTFQPSYLDLRLNNTCNLKCRTCDGRASSQLAQEEKKLFDNSFNLDRIPNKISRSRALEKVIGFVEQSNDIYFAGGEPLLMHEHFAILDHLIELNKTDVRLRYNTNFTLQSYKNRNILDIWQLFPNVALAASLDGHGAIFEYVRHGASWSDIEKNFLALKTKCPHVEFTVSSTISIFSAESVMELQKKWHQSGMLDIKYFKLNSVSTNDYFNLCSLLPHHKTYLSKKIDDHIDWLMSIGGIELASDWQMCKQTMWQHDKKYLSLMIASVNRARDIERKENFESLFPQFADLFDNNGAKTQFNFVR